MTMAYSLTTKKTRLTDFYLGISWLEEIEGKMARAKNKHAKFYYSTPKRNVTKNSL